MVPGVAAAGWLSNKLSLKGFNVGQQRKICESLCGCTEAFCLICIGKNQQPKCIWSYFMLNQVPWNQSTQFEYGWNTHPTIVKS